MNAAPLRQRNFALLWFAGLISVSGDWMLRIALPIFVYQMTGSIVAIGGVVMASVLPSLLFGLFAGVFVDRWDRRRVMIVASVLQGVAILPLMLIDSPDRMWIVYVVAFVEATLVQFFVPAETALLPKVVPADQLTAANSLNALNNNLGRLAGPFLGGFGVLVLGMGGVAIFDAATFFVAALLVWLVKGSFRADAGAADRLGLRSELADGFRAIGQSRVVTALLVVLGISSIGEGVMSSLFAPFVIGPLAGGAKEMGYLMSAQAVGGIAGGLLGARYAGRFSARKLVVTCMVLFGAIDVAIFNYPRLATAIAPEIAMFALVGIPSVIGGAAMMTLVQTEVPDARMGRVFSVALVVESLARLAGAGIASATGESLGVINVLTIQGLGYVVAGIAFAVITAGVWRFAPSTRPASERDPHSAPGRAG